MARPGSGPPHAVILALFLFSGATSLVYEVIWLRQLILIFGSTQFATSAILSTFMGGLALGAFVSGRRLARVDAPPLRVYGLLEIGIGIYAAWCHSPRGTRACASSCSSGSATC